MANGNGYSAGNLEFVLQTFGKDTISTLDAVISRLTTMTSLLGSTSSITRAIGTTAGRRSSGGASFNPKETNKQLKVSSIRLSNILNKVYFIRNYTKQMFRTLTGIIKNAVEYTETLNLWQVAMRGNTEEAEEFIKTMNKGYGIATQTLMQYQAIFKNMLSSLGGLTSDASYALSEYLTQMALDYASLYNVSIERAMTTFQSVLSGQVRPIRSIAGYDITETTIYQLYQQLGGTKTMRQLSQAEKRLLRIYAVFQQMESSGAIGDLGKTMESTANQWRVFQEATKELGTWLGILFEHYIKPILPYVNAFVITLTNVVKKIAELNNIKPQEFGLVEGLQETNEQVDELQGKLLGFDKFSVLGQGGAEDNALGIDSNLLAGLSKYSSILADVTGKAQELAEQWTNALIDTETGEWTDKALEFKQTISDIASILGVLIGYKISSKLVSILLPLGDISKSLKTIFKSWKNFGISALITALGYLYISNEDFRESINNLFNALSPLVSLLSDLLTGILKPLTPLLTAIVDMIGFSLTASVKIATFALNAFLIQLIPIAFVLEFIIKLVRSLIQGLSDLATFNWGNFGKNQSEIWSNWKSVDFAKSRWGDFKSSFTGMFTGYKNGGLVEDGLFQMSRGELVGEFDDGTTVVANNQQIIEGIKQGVYTAVRSAMGSGASGDIVLKVDSKEIARATVGATANALSKNYRVDFQPR